MNPNQVYVGIGVLALLSLGVALMWFINSHEKDSELKNETVVAFGDSLISGEGASEGNDVVSLLERSLKREIINLGVSGDTTEDGQRRIDAVLQEDPGLVIVLLGGNDALRRVPILETKEHLSAIIEALQANGSKVILLGVQGGILNDPYRAMFASLQVEHNVILVPNILEGILTDGELMNDAIQPNDAGYARIAPKIEAAIRPFID